MLSLSPNPLSPPLWEGGDGKEGGDGGERKGLRGRRVVRRERGGSKIVSYHY